MPQLSFLQWLELAAVALAVLYLLLAIRQNIWCWAAAAVSTTLYLFIMYAARLYAEAALQIFYLAMAVYGWYQWRRGGANHHGVEVSTWPMRKHVVAVLVVFTLVLVSGGLLQRFSDAALPFADAFTTWGAVVATWMVARKILENWVYWFVIDAVSVYLYVSRELYFTSVLFVAYLVMIVFGYRSWKRSMLEQEG
ncbi:MAG: nicotinamide mononucleotide transporter [Xanthomonadales bacterium]|nr:nicotinamide riboside transporter PnuC [Gammaproteobacteria bacterium]MBT8052069.1 nicotinamide riboside transporter PnuC [Gammaproteobacteria bacterium]MBT8055317.1 nicotinamide riboside transporter PnuC [Gammaproteobacteria bacterium]NNJ78053.1 nicotinamide mononucleotide transporter [Xanthomonadales bacterium]NNL05510.1 nicotinamide mononucleotide transporter [Xanthomonadales bacterium]